MEQKESNVINFSSECDCKKNDVDEVNEAKGNDDITNDLKRQFEEDESHENEIEADQKKLIEAIVSSINYKAMFNALDQSDEQYQKFIDYVEDFSRQHENGTASEDINVRSWFEFIEDKPVTTKSLAMVYELLIQFIIYTSISTANATFGSIYDHILDKQFTNIHEMFEGLAHALGSLHRKIDDMSNDNN